jgi:ABC-type branched-subunit amino acid transport system ATPase component
MPAVIEVQHLHKSYGDTVAVEDVSFTVQEGEIFGILGPNGAGKTTTVECIEGLRAPDCGEISVLGLDPRRDRSELTQRLGVQLQDSQLPDRLRVAEALELYSSFYRAPADWHALMNVLGLAGKSRTRFGKLSGGQKQRLSIALALAGSPQVAVLDERYGVFLPRQLAGFVIAALLAAAALLAVGLFIAAVAPGGRAAQAIGTLTFFPMMFFAGLWLPIPQMPSLLRHISHATPLGAAAGRAGGGPVGVAVAGCRGSAGGAREGARRGPRAGE